MKHPKKQTRLPQKFNKTKPLSYDHLQGNPLDPANHASFNLPEPQGGMFNGEAPNQFLSPPSNTLDFDNTAG